MPKLRWYVLVLLSVLLSACGVPREAAQAPRVTAAPAPPQPSASPQPAATEPAAQPTLTPAAQPTPTSAPAAAPSAAPTAAKGEEVLRLTAGAGTRQVGITADAGPTTFRVAADGSLRVMDVVNKRLLFFNGSSGNLEQTIDLSFLQRPTDFVVTGKGDLYVLDADGWTLDHLAISGKKLNTIPLNPKLKRLFTTISLTADGRLVGLGAREAYVLLTDSGPLSLEDQLRATIPGSVTVRSNALFSIAPDMPGLGQRQLVINDSAGLFDLGKVEGQATFVDINQGMEPYVLVEQGGTTEVRRYNVAGTLLGTLKLDRSGCRAATRWLYVDRPGDVFTMCVGDQGMTITRYTMTDAQGQPLPLFQELVTTAPWSPGNLQAAPG